MLGVCGFAVAIGRFGDRSSRLEPKTGSGFRVSVGKDCGIAIAIPRTPIMKCSVIPRIPR